MAATTHGIKAGKAFVLIEAVDMTSRILDKVRNRLGQFGSDISNLGQTIAFRSAAALTPIAMSLNTFAKFDDSLRVVEARSKGTAGEMDNLRQQARDLGRTTAFTASHIGQLMARLAQAKKTRGEIFDMTEPIVNLARAGASPAGNLEEDILNAADATTQVMAAYHMETEDTEHVVNLLAATVNNSRFSLEELNTALQYGAAAGKAYNVPLEDTLVILAAMRDLGYDASIAGTFFRNIHQHAVQSKEQEAFNQGLKELTGNTVAFSNAGKDLQNPVDMLVAIMKSVSGLGTAEKGDLLTNLFESRAATPAMAIGAATDNLARMRAVLSDVGGTAKRTKDDLEAGMGGAFRILASTVEDIQIAIGYALNGAVRDFTGGAENAAKAISDWIDKNRGWVALTVITVTAVGALGLSLIVLGQTLRMLAATLYLVVLPLQLFAFLLSPAGILAISLIAMLGLLPILISFFRDIGTALAGAFSEMKASFEESLSGVATYLEHGEVQQAFELLSIQVQLIWKKMLDGMMTAWEIFETGFKAADPITDYMISSLEGKIKKQKDLIGVMQPGWFRGTAETDLKKMEDKLAALKGTREGILAEIGAPHAARAQEIKDLEARLQLLQDSAEIFRQLQTEAPSSSSSLSPPEIGGKLQELMDAADKLIMPGQITAQRLDPLMGVEAGSVEAARHSQENRVNALGQGISKLVSIAQDSDRHLASIDQKLTEQAISFVGV